MFDFQDRVERGHIQYRLRCLNCGLHFTVFSWYRDWAKKTGGAYCPECGYRNGAILLRAKQSRKQIFEMVPGVLEEESLFSSGAKSP